MDINSPQTGPSNGDMRDISSCDTCVVHVCTFSISSSQETIVQNNYSTITTKEIKCHRVSGLKVPIYQVANTRGFSGLLLLGNPCLRSSSVSSTKQLVSPCFRSPSVRASVPAFSGQDIDQTKQNTAML